MPLLTNAEKVSYDTVVTESVRNIGGEIDATNSKIVDISEPTNAKDAATKNYVDTALDNVFQIGYYLSEKHYPMQYQRSF